MFPLKSNNNIKYNSNPILPRKEVLESSTRFLCMSVRSSCRRFTVGNLYEATMATGTERQKYNRILSKTVRNSALDSLFCRCSKRLFNLCRYVTLEHSWSIHDVSTCVPLFKIIAGSVVQDTRPDAFHNEGKTHVVFCDILNKIASWSVCERGKQSAGEKAKVVSQIRR